MRLTPRLLIVALLLPLSLTACGEDSESASGTASPAAAETSAAEDDSTEAPPSDAVVVDAGTDHDTTGYAIDSVLDSVDDYRVEGNTIVLESNVDSATGSSVCIIATTAAEGVGSTAKITVEFTDTTVAC